MTRCEGDCNITHWNPCQYLQLRLLRCWADSVRPPWDKPIQSLRCLLYTSNFSDNFPKLTRQKYFLMYNIFILCQCDKFSRNKFLRMHKIGILAHLTVRTETASCGYHCAILLVVHQLVQTWYNQINLQKKEIMKLVKCCSILSSQMVSMDFTAVSTTKNKYLK